MSALGLEYTTARAAAEEDAHRNAEVLARVRRWCAAHGYPVTGNMFVHALEAYARGLDSTPDAGWPRENPKNGDVNR